LVPKVPTGDGFGTGAIGPEAGAAPVVAVVADPGVVVVDDDEDVEDVELAHAANPREPAARATRVAVRRRRRDMLGVLSGGLRVGFRAVEGPRTESVRRTVAAAGAPR
jgi:hypothetical protein